MAIERTYVEVAPRLLTANGAANGLLTLQSTEDFKVKMRVVLRSNTQGVLALEVKRVLSETQLYVGPIEKNINSRSNVTAFLVADGATLEASEQPRPSIAPDDYERAVYEEEPTVADRVYLVDKLGRGYTQSNRFPVDLTMNSASTPVVSVLQAVAANTEYSFPFPNGVKKIRVKDRDLNNTLKIAFVMGEVAAGNNFYTLRPGNEFKEDDVLGTSITLYLASAKANREIEILYWL